MDTDPQKKCIKIKNIKAGNFFSTLLIKEFRNYRENNFKIGQKNKETNFNNLTDQKTWLKHDLVNLGSGGDALTPPDSPASPRSPDQRQFFRYDTKKRKRVYVNFLPYR